MKRLGSVALIVCISGLLASACGTDGAAGRGTGESPEPTVPGTPATPSTAEADTSADSGNTTPPGTTLGIGEQAIVPFEFGTSKKGTLGITVTAIDEGNKDKFKQKFGEKAKGAQPYYIRAKIENVGGTDLSSVSVDLNTVDPSGNKTTLFVLGELPDCEEEYSPREFKNKGDTFETCILQVAKDGQTVAGATYDEENYEDKPIQWNK